MSLFCEMNEINNESDVEQKFILPLLTRPYPMGLGYANRHIYTKTYINSQIIEKGNKAKHYIPDYLVYLQGIPVLVIEAKTPNTSLNDAYREAQLYSQIVNSKFGHKKNPCNKIIATDGFTLWAGYFDCAEPEIIMKFDEFVIGGVAYERLLTFASYSSLNEQIQAIFVALKGDAKFIKPITELGTKLVQNEEIPSNSFGNTLSFDYQNVFTPDSVEDIINIVNNAYVTSKRRDRTTEPIYKTVKKDISFVYNNTTQLFSEEPQPIFDSIARSKKSLILLIGNRGSGKTTFIRYLNEKMLSAEMKAATVWLYIDMNNANISRNGVYDWLSEKIYSQLSHKFKEDFDSLEIIEKVLSEKLNQLDKWIGKIYDKNSDEYKKEKVQIIKETLNDSQKKMKAYTDYFLKKYNKTCVVVFDNCDKKDSKDQLLMFEVAQWLRDECPFLIIMPLRDSTYDSFRDQPPLDTVIKDLAFRIDPPDFLKVLQARLQYIYYLNKHKVTSTFNVSSSMHVKLKENEHLEYFKSILNSIRNDSYAKNMFYGLAGRNIRKGIEIFLEFCKSGHITASKFLEIRAEDGLYTLPSHILINALIRQNRKYYNDEISPIKNLFSSQFYDTPPDPYARLDILTALSYYRKQNNYIENFVKIDVLLQSLSAVGHNENVILRELHKLIQYDLVTYEAQTDNIEKDGHIRISVSGSQHLKLLSNITYLGACAEDVYYRNTEIATAISERMRYLSNKSDYKNITYENAKTLVDYLIEYQKIISVRNDEIVIPGICVDELMNLKTCLSSLESFKHMVTGGVSESIKEGDKVDFMITNIQSYGVFGIFENNLSGFIHVSNFDDSALEICEENDMIIAEVMEFSNKHKRYQLKFVDLM